jgi:hypothetical protein
MSDASTTKDDDSDLEMRPEYDFSGGVRGKYASRFAKGSKVVVLDPDVAAVFDSSEAVNAALRERLAERERKAAGDGGA